MKRSCKDFINFILLLISNQQICKFVHAEVRAAGVHHSSVLPDAAGWIPEFNGGTAAAHPVVDRPLPQRLVATGGSVQAGQPDAGRAVAAAAQTGGGVAGNGRHDEDHRAGIGRGGEDVDDDPRR